MKTQIFWVLFFILAIAAPAKAADDTSTFESVVHFQKNYTATCLAIGVCPPSRPYYTVYLQTVEPLFGRTQVRITELQYWGEVAPQSIVLGNVEVEEGDLVRITGVVRVPRCGLDTSIRCLGGAAELAEIRSIDKLQANELATEFHCIQPGMADAGVGAWVLRRGESTIVITYNLWFGGSHLWFASMPTRQVMGFGPATLVLSGNTVPFSQAAGMTAVRSMALSVSSQANGEGRFQGSLTVFESENSSNDARTFALECQR